MRVDVDGNKKIIPKRKKKHSNVFHYTVVVSQYEKKNDVSFSITAYSTLPCRFRPVSDLKIWKFKKVVVGQWSAKLSGGCQNFDSFTLNPQYRIKLGESTHVRLLLEAPIEYSVSIQLYRCALPEELQPKKKKKMKKKVMMVDGGDNKPADEKKDDDDSDAEKDEDAQGEEGKEGKEEPRFDVDDYLLGYRIDSREKYRRDLLVQDSGAYRYGVTTMDVSALAEGTYIAIVSTFDKGQLGPFKFTLRAPKNIGLTPV
jgi:hypothetical protein